MRKILTSFIFGLLLSVVPITGLAFSGKTVNITRLFFGSCPETIQVPFTIQQGDITIEADVTCKLTGESPDTGDGVSVCSYSCIAGSNPPT